MSLIRITTLGGARSLWQWQAQDAPEGRSVIIVSGRRHVVKETPEEVNATLGVN